MTKRIFLNGTGIVGGLSRKELFYNITFEEIPINFGFIPVVNQIHFNTIAREDLMMLYNAIREKLNLDKSDVFVAHVDNHLIEKEMHNAKVMCKICDKTIDEIYLEEKQSELNYINQE